MSGYQRLLCRWTRFFSYELFHYDVRRILRRILWRHDFLNGLICISSICWRNVTHEQTPIKVSIFPLFVSSFFTVVNYSLKEYWRVKNKKMKNEVEIVLPRWDFVQLIPSSFILVNLKDVKEWKEKIATIGNMNGKSYIVDEQKSLFSVKSSWRRRRENVCFIQKRIGKHFLSTTLRLDAELYYYWSLFVIYFFFLCHIW